MSNVVLKGQKVQEVEFVSKLENGTKVELETKYSYNVSYSNTNMCRGEVSVIMSDKKTPDKFKIKVVLLGVFSFKQGVPKETIHVETYKELFPYVRAFVTNLTANAGIPPIIVPGIDIEAQSIYRFEKPVDNFKPEEDEE